jgi:hypothetical protein
MYPDTNFDEDNPNLGRRTKSELLADKKKALKNFQDKNKNKELL